jgi:hypothetical protein
MKVPDMGDPCKQYLRWLLRGVTRSSFQCLSRVPESELFRGLAVPARQDIHQLFGQGPGSSSDIPGAGDAHLGNGRRPAIDGASLGGSVATRISELIYAYRVVSSGRVNFEREADAPSSASNAWAKDYLHHVVALHEMPLGLDEDLTGSLPNPVANPHPLSELDYQNAANTLGIDVAAIKAVAHVESRGSGFGSDGRPVLRFELHRFHVKTKGVFHKTHPHLSQPGAGGRGRYHNGTQAREYSLLYNAMLLHDKGTSMVDCAIESASWGKFQVMGENWSELGWSSALHFASDMFAAEGNQLKACVKFIQAKGLKHALKSHDWAAFARGYNGAGYAESGYDSNLAQAFNRISRNLPAAAHP